MSEVEKKTQKREVLDEEQVEKVDGGIAQFSYVAKEAGCEVPAGNDPLKARTFEDSLKAGARLDNIQAANPDRNARG